MPAKPQHISRSTSASENNHPHAHLGGPPPLRKMALDELALLYHDYHIIMPW
jgi:hypothetical protein|tara:strand:- start:158 stop:313 length:156 start_codon:yes stop_codon:yes gene_type:complete